jgi:anti-sigma regulatory factor (Ser/Thr protein kinase)
MHKQFARSNESLTPIYDFIETFLDDRGVAESARYPVHFAIEELFTNMVKYSPGNTNKIMVDVDADDTEVTVTITDYDVEPFDVTKKRAVDTQSPVDERPVGGLGLHLIRHMVDSLSYHYADRKSHITFTKGTQ